MVDEIIVRRCDLCGEGVECIGIEAELALENEWYISPFTDFCSECRETEYAARVIRVETNLIKSAAQALR